jgi:hypothetical protein
MSLGYQDTPTIPGTNWHVHDGQRPQPPKVMPGDLSSRPPIHPPSDAIILFDGSARSAANWVHVKDGSPLQWVVENGYMEVKPGTGDIRTTSQFPSPYQLHVEWAAPFEIETRNGEQVAGQGRGNSGVFLDEIYEVQVLDCWNNPTYADGLATAIYGQKPPLVNACCPRGRWHIYDILWTGPTFDGDTLKSPAYITVFHNGVCVHNHVELTGNTPHKKIGTYTAHGPGGVTLQDHSNPNRFRNIWLRELGEYS